MARGGAGLEQLLLYSANMNLRSTCPLFGEAIYTVMVVLICTSAQAQNLFVSCGVGSLEYPVTTGSVIFEFTPGGTQISFASGFFASGLDAPRGWRLTVRAICLWRITAVAKSMNSRRAECKAPLRRGYSSYCTGL